MTQTVEVPSFMHSRLHVRVDFRVSERMSQFVS